MPSFLEACPGLANRLNTRKLHKLLPQRTCVRGDFTLESLNMPACCESCLHYGPSRAGLDGSCVGKACSSVEWTKD